MWWLRPRWRSRRSPAESRGESRVGICSESAAAVQSGETSVAEMGCRADDPGAGTGNNGIPAKAASASIKRPDHAERLVFAPVGRRGRYMTAQRPPRAAASRHGRATRQGTSCSLHISELQSRGLLAAPPRRGP